MLKYMITDPKYSLSEIFSAVKKHKPDFVCYRNKEYFNEDEIVEFCIFVKKYSKTIINLDSLKKEYLIKCFNGVHLPSAKLSLINRFKNKIVIASTHNEKEIFLAKNADFITFSPVFDSKGRKGEGIDRLEEICKLHPNVFALGGVVSDREVEEIKKTTAVGFGSIRYFFT